MKTYFLYYVSPLKGEMVRIPFPTYEKAFIAAEELKAGIEAEYVIEERKK